MAKGLSSWQSFAHHSIAFEFALDFLDFLGFIVAVVIKMGYQNLGFDQIQCQVGGGKIAFGFGDQIKDLFLQFFKHGGGLRYALAYRLPLPAAQLGSSNPVRPVRPALGGVDPPALPAVFAVGARVKARAGGAGA